jgi:CDP-glucose 4,6-dehydratase
MPLGRFGEFMYLQKIFKNKKVLVTGHSGFKGSWLTAWLLELGAEITGLSLDVPTTPSMNKSLKIEKKINEIFVDIRNELEVKKIINEVKPDFIFHLAAQALVSESYINPLETITTNVVGTAIVLDAIRELKDPCVVVIITSDKCYENKEWVWGYRETDQLGGKDIYSASKGAAELIYHSFHRSFLANHSSIKSATGRAGNVIGGGDWAKDRIVVDCIKSWANDVAVSIRNPHATRPWQHVLEPLSGYLLLAATIYESKDSVGIVGNSYNFGPSPGKSYSVGVLIKELAKHWSISDPKISVTPTDKVGFNEAGLLSLVCEKAAFDLQWHPTLDFHETVKFTVDWYKNFYLNDGDMYGATVEQIRKYVLKGQGLEQKWAMK